jgi:hypothetical protein
METQMYHGTLNKALAAAHPDCVTLWPLGSNVPYGCSVWHLVETGVLKGKRQTPEYRLISVYRNERGMYETATTYITN